VTVESQWTWTFENLPKYRDGGIEIEYTVSEEAVEGYEATVEGFNITNTHEPETTEVSGSKTWNDAENQDGKRPESIEINLLADGEEIASKTVTEAEEWAWIFENLPKYRDGGVEIVYTITEDAIEEYASEVNGYDVTNSYTPEQTSVSVSKAWADGDNQDGLRPESVTVKLYADGVDTGLSVNLNAENNWSASFTGLDVYKDGIKIAYTVEENVVDGYTAAISGNAVDGYIVTNTHTPATVNVGGIKIWEDANNVMGIRPASITINVYANGKLVTSEQVTAETGWAWNIGDMPKYANGDAIVYTITENAVAGYYAVIRGLTVTNYVDLVVIEDEEVPLSPLPQTGDTAALGLWSAMTGMSGAGLAAMGFLGRKKKEEDEEK